MKYFIPADAQELHSFQGSTLVLPQPSLGSLAQLATDLIVHNFSLKLVGYVGLDDHVPAVSGRDALPGENAPEGVSFATQVFTGDVGGKMSVWVLPRSPVIRKRREHWARAMRSWVEDQKFAEVLVVSSVDAGSRGDDGLRSETPLRHLLLSPTSPLSTTIEAISPPYVDAPLTPSTIPALPHGGLTPLLLSALATTSVPTSALLIYSSEGDNKEAAQGLAGALAKVVGLGEKAEWREPVSWEAGLLGEELGRERIGELYG